MHWKILIVFSIPILVILLFWLTLPLTINNFKYFLNKNFWNLRCNNIIEKDFEFNFNYSLILQRPLILISSNIFILLLYIYTCFELKFSIPLFLIFLIYEIFDILYLIIYWNILLLFAKAKQGKIYCNFIYRMILNNVIKKTMKNDNELIVNKINAILSSFNLSSLYGINSAYKEIFEIKNQNNIEIDPLFYDYLVFKYICKEKNLHYSKIDKYLKNLYKK